jgi:hypothetical protein
MAPIGARTFHAYRASDTFLANGCGQRASYKLEVHTMLLLSIVKVDPPSILPAHEARSP